MDIHGHVTITWGWERAVAYVFTKFHVTVLQQDAHQ